MGNCTDDYAGKEINFVGSFTFHEMARTLNILLAIIASSFSFYLFFRHGLHFMNPKEQKHSMRIILMIPIYTLSSTLATAFPTAHVYLITISETYEAFALASFFLLLVALLGENEGDEGFMRGVQPRSWVPFKKRKVDVEPRNGEGRRWFGNVWTCVFQYCLVKGLLAVAICITQSQGVFCELSTSIKAAAIWIKLIQAISLMTTMYALSMFYLQFRAELKKHNPGLKFIAIKIVVFLAFAQTFILDKLTKPNGIIKPTSTISARSLRIDIPNLLLTGEMVGVTLMHLRAYPWKVYSTANAFEDGMISPPGSGSFVEKGEGVVVREVSGESDMSGDSNVSRDAGKLSLGGAIHEVFDFRDYWAGLKRSSMWVLGKREVRAEEVL